MDFAINVKVSDDGGVLEEKQVMAENYDEAIMESGFLENYLSGIDEGRVTIEVAQA